MGDNKVIPVSEIYRPSPTGSSLDPDQIPVWQEEFYQLHRGRWTMKLAMDPAGPDKPTLNSATECGPGECESLKPEAIGQLWKIYGPDFDGLFKRTNSFGKVDYYFWRSPINDPTPSDAVCKGETVTLSGTFSRTEGVVLELWTPLSERIGFAACSSASNGEFYYKANLKDKDLYQKTKEGLERLSQALQWKKDHPGQKENPYNPDSLSLDISLDKVKAIQSQFLKKDAGDIWEYLKYGVMAIVGAFVAGFGFAGGGDLWNKIFKRPPKEPPSKDPPSDDPPAGSAGNGAFSNGPKALEDSAVETPLSHSALAYIGIPVDSEDLATQVLRVYGGEKKGAARATSITLPNTQVLPTRIFTVATLPPPVSLGLPAMRGIAVPAIRPIPVAP
jgi:hypothetical protein